MSALAWLALGIFGVSLAVIVGVLVYALLGTVCPAEEPVGKAEQDDDRARVVIGCGHCGRRGGEVHADWCFAIARRQ